MSPNFYSIRPTLAYLLFGDPLLGPFFTFCSLTTSTYFSYVPQAHDPRIAANRGTQGAHILFRRLSGLGCIIGPVFRHHVDSVVQPGSVARSGNAKQGWRCLWIFIRTFAKPQKHSPHRLFQWGKIFFDDKPDARHIDQIVLVP